MDLTKIPTRQLMSIRDKCYKFGGRYDPCGMGCGTSDSTVTLDQVKTELATRPHVPNKMESRVIRQKMARNRV